MIRSQGYWMDLECSDCGAKRTFHDTGKQTCIKNARGQGWSFSQSSHACWCPECKTDHTLRKKVQNSGIGRR